jgi:hypothetical protein
MPTADLASLGSQLIAQQPAARKGKRQMQLVKPPHDREVGCRYWPGQVIDATPADVQCRRLLGDRQIVRTVDHRFALSRPALPSAPSKNSSVSSPIFACSDFTSTVGCPLRCRR